MIDGFVESHAVSLAERTSRRSLIARLGRGFIAIVGGPFVAIALQPGRAQAHHVCGHLYTTNSCPHPFDPHTRIDKYGFPVHPEYGYPVDDEGSPYTSKEQVRRKICQEVVPERYPHTGKPKFGGGWNRCCNGRVRHLTDCCSFSDTRINGDASVTGYCHNGRKVFCIAYRDTEVKC